GDPMVADYLLRPAERSHNLEELAAKYLRHSIIPITDLIGTKSKKKPQLSMDQVPTDHVAKYAGEDAAAAWRLAGLLAAQLEQMKTEDGDAPLARLYRELEVPLIDMLVEMQFLGVRLDVPLLQGLGAEMGAQLEAIEKEIYALAGKTFNIGSLPQLRQV